MTLSLKTCYSCGKVIQGNLKGDNKKQSNTGECKDCRGKRERESGKDGGNG